MTEKENKTVRRRFAMDNLITPSIVRIIADGCINSITTFGERKKERKKVISIIKELRKFLNKVIVPLQTNQNKLKIST